MMNKNIKLLAMNARVSTGYYPFKDTEDPGWAKHDQFIEKLVNLVIEESIEQIEKVSNRHGNITAGDMYIDAALRDAAFEISQHFRSTK